MALVGVLAWQSVQATVQIEGLKAALEANVRAHMRLDDESCDAEADKLRYRYERAPGEIRAGLKPFGFYDPNVSRSPIPPTGWPRQWIV